MKVFYVMLCLLATVFGPFVPKLWSSDLGSALGGGSAAKNVRIGVTLKPAELKSTLERLGYTITNKDKPERFARFTVKSKKGYNYGIVASIYKEHLTYHVCLSSIKPGEEAKYAANILQLMRLSGNFGPAYFDYVAKYRSFWLRVPVANENMTSEKLRKGINDLVIIGDLTAAYWRTSLWRLNQPKHVGSWSHSQDGKNIELKLNGNGTFSLVTAMNGGKERFSGNYTLNGETLALTGTDGAKVTASIVFEGGNRFTLVLNSKRMLFVRS